jgi:hypothetical protein
MPFPAVAQCLALYPDPMLALMLPAAGRPVDIVLADRC